MSNIITASEVVWANDDASANAIYHPLTSGMPAGGFKTIRVAVEVSHRSGGTNGVNLQAYYEVTSNLDDWSGTQTAFGPTAGDTSPAYQTTTTELSPPTAARFIRFGVKALNDSGSDFNVAFATLKIETIR